MRGYRPARLAKLGRLVTVGGANWVGLYINRSPESPPLAAAAAASGAGDETKSVGADASAGIGDGTKNEGVAIVDGVVAAGNVFSIGNGLLDELIGILDGFT